MFKKSKYVYTCPDVINYRKNQYRLAIWSNVLNFAFLAAFWGALAAIGQKYKNEPIEIIESDES